MLHLPEHRQAIQHPKLFGWIYEHRVIAEEFMGRPLRDDEEVHHLDEDKLNNHPENLLVLPNSQHLKLHAWMKRMNIDPTAYPTRYCKTCNKVLAVVLVNYCSTACAAVGTRKVTRPTRDELIDDISKLPMIWVGAKYGVSDNAVRKWCKAYRIEIPRKKFRAVSSSGLSADVDGN